MQNIIDPILYLSFLATSLVLIILPGPNVLVIVSTSLTYGSKRGLQTVLGTSSAMLIQLVIAALGTTWLVTSLMQGFQWVRWLGIVYLLYLGIDHIRKMLRQSNNDAATLTACGTFSRGFVVSLTNPKTILFFSAFFPQFVVNNGLYFLQITVYSITFLILAMLLDSLYAILAAKMNSIYQGQHLHKLHHGVSGTLFIGAATWLALMKRI